MPSLAVVGLEGIYDIPLLARNHVDQPVYADILRGAFGDEEQVRRDASPVSGDYGAASWPQGRLVVLAHSREDQLVEWEQVEVMQEALERSGWTIGEGSDGSSDERRVVILETKGDHDNVWKDGNQLADAILMTVKLLAPNDSES